MDQVRRITYYTLSPDLSQKTFMNLKSAIKSKPYLIIEEKSGIWYNLEYTNAALEYTLYDQEGAPILFLEEGGWVLGSISVGINGYFQKINVYAEIKDPGGHSTGSICFGQYYNSLTKAFQQFRDMTAHESLEHYNLYVANCTLEKEIEEQKSKNQIIQKQIDELMGE